MTNPARLRPSSKATRGNVARVVRVGSADPPPRCCRLPRECSSSSSPSAHSSDTQHTLAFRGSHSARCGWFLQACSELPRPPPPGELGNRRRRPGAVLLHRGQTRWWRCSASCQMAAGPPATVVAGTVAPPVCQERFPHPLKISPAVSWTAFTATATPGAARTRAHVERPDAKATAPKCMNITMHKTTLRIQTHNSTGLRSVLACMVVSRCVSLCAARS